jgi:hypothetical protein
MAITQTFVVTRPDTSVDFHYDISTPAVNAAKSAFQQYHNAGTLTVTSSLSGDGLTRTGISTVTDLATLSARDTIASLALDAEYANYDSTHKHTTSSYTLSGIDAAFTCTTVYTFPSAGIPVHDTLSAEINTQNGFNNNLKNLTVTDTVITAVHTYANAADYTEKYWNDFSLATSLAAANVTRTVTYAMV